MRNEWLPVESRTPQDRRTDIEIRVDELVALLVTAKAVPKEQADDLKYALDTFADAIVTEARR